MAGERTDLDGVLALHGVGRETFLLTADRLERRSPWSGRRTTISFATVKRVTYDDYGRFVLVTEAGERLAVSHRIDGIGELAGTILREVPGAALEESKVVRPMLEYIALKAQAAGST